MRRLLLTLLIILLLLMEVDSWWNRRRRRRRRSPPPCPTRDCSVGGWGAWGGCSYPCGNGGTRTRYRPKTVVEQCGGTCRYSLSESQRCNIGRCTACYNGRCYTTGNPHGSGCSCIAGYTGQCCNQDVDECRQRPCQHICKNTFGSFTCRCQPCYTKLGTRCELRQCSIGGVCYTYGEVNPNNICQICNQASKTSWSVNTRHGTGKCNDRNLCTRNDRCQQGRCVGEPFACLSCQSCNGSTCVLNPGHCLINGTCYRDDVVRIGRPCQECDSSQPFQWTTNNNLQCSDNNPKTKDDRCVKGYCWGVPYSCLSCQDPDGSGGCTPKQGYCVIQHDNRLICFAHGQTRPGNPCQMCNTSRSKVAWTSRDRVPCDDGDLCTSDDTCHRGLCKGDKFSCTSPCQYCNGTGCSLNRGYGYQNGNCTCMINGAEYHHQSPSPSNPCLWCDLYDVPSKKRSGWSVRPSMPCDDNNPCTKRDHCNQGRCQGTPYTCSGRFPASSCIQTSLCNGDGTCRDVVKSRGTVCRAATDECDTAEKCDGRLGSCPKATTNPIHFSSGSVQIRDNKFIRELQYQSDLRHVNIFLLGLEPDCGFATYHWFQLDGSSACSISSSPKAKGILTGDAPAFTLNNLPVLDDKSYKVAIQATDVRNASLPPLCSGIVTMDTSKPAGGWARDSPGVDVDFQSTKLIAANWGGFRTRHGVQRFEWRVVYYRHGSNVSRELLPYTSVSLDTSTRKVFDTLRDGGKVKVQVRAYTKAGLFSEVETDGVMIDASPPIAGAVRDGANMLNDQRFAKWFNTFHANWDRFIDNHTKVTHYAWAVKRKGFGLITPYRVTPRGYPNSWMGLNLVSGERYCAVVKAFNQAGLSSQASSNCVLIDRQPPRPDKVYDGLEGDIDHQTENASLSAHWEAFSDGQKGSGIVNYMYLVKDGDGRVIVNWSSFNASDVRNVTVTGLKLRNGVKYFVATRAVDAVGLTTDVTSDGVVVDASRPAFNGRMVITGEKNTKSVNSAAPCVYVSSTTSIKVSWPGFTDAHTGIQRYEYAVVAAAQQPLIQDFKRFIGRQTSSTITNLGLQAGRHYRVVIRAYNNAGLYTDISSCVFVPDTTPPLTGKIVDGSNLDEDMDYQTDLNTVTAIWEGFTDSESGIKEYFIAVGSCDKGNYHATNNRFIRVTSNTTSITIRARLMNGFKYCVKIKAKNKAGLFSNEVSSNGFIPDATPPDVSEGEVRDGLDDVDIDYQSNPDKLSGNWAGFTDPESGLRHYEVGVGNKAGHPNIISFRSVNLSTSFTFTNITLQEFRVYYIIVCGVNFAGLRSCISSDGILYDPTPPSQGIVRDGILEPDLQYQSDNNTIAANWEGIWDTQSGIAKFEWAVGTNLSNTINIQTFTDIGLSTHVQTANNLSLMHGQKYYVSLRVTNQAGSVRELMSDGVTVDLTPPIPSAIKPGIVDKEEWAYNREYETYYSSTAGEVSAYWKTFSEPESAVLYYKWAIGTTRCGTQVQTFINIGQSTSASAKMADLNPKGVPYFVTVIARNRAGLVSQSCSDAVVVDYSPPSMGQVTVGTKRGEHKQYLLPRQVQVHWSDATDDQSGITQCNISVWSNDNDKLLDVTIGKGANNSYSPLSASFKEGIKYRVTLTCSNRAGLASNTLSPPFYVVETPPWYNGQINVGISSNGSLNFQADTSTIKASWDNFNYTHGPVVSYRVSVGSQSLHDDISKYTDVGLHTDWDLKNLSLNHGSIYYINVMAINVVGLNATVSSKGLLIDTTAPEIHNDILGSIQASGVSSNVDISGHWNVTDQESGILRAEVCIGTTPYGCQIQDFKVIGLSTSFVCKSCDVDHGETVYMTVRVTNMAGLSTTAHSNGMVYDTTGPDIGKVQTKDRQVRVRGSNITVFWYGVEDLESGIKVCTWVIEDEDSRVYYQRELNPPKLGERFTLKTDWNSTTLSNVTSDELLFNTIYCTNKAGIGSFAKSSPFKIYPSPYPKPGKVRNGEQGVHRNFSQNTQVVSANWDLFESDMLDPVVLYSWAVGTQPGGEDVLRFTEVGLASAASKRLANEGSGIDALQPGGSFFITVKAETESGLASSQISESFIVDSTPPLKVNLVVSHTIVKQAPPTVDLKISWEGVKDDESGIEKISYCVGHIEGDCDDTPIDAEGNTFGVIPELSLKDKEELFATVIVTNNAGLSRILTKMVSIDVTPPVAGVVTDGLSGFEGYSNSSNSMTVTYRGFKEEETKIAKCQWSLLQILNSTRENIVFQQEVPVNETQFTRSDLSLLAGFYKNMITCENTDGFAISSKSTGVIVDLSPPIVGKVSDGEIPGLDIDYQSSLTTVQATWTHFEDSESGIHEFRVAVGDATSDESVLPFLSVGRRTSWRVNNLTLDIGTLFHVTVEAYNGAGLSSRSFSDGFMVDVTKPSIVITSSSPAWIGPSDFLQASWISKDEESGITLTEYCVGTSPTTCQVQDMRTLPQNTTNTTCSDCDLKHRTTYYTLIRVWNRANTFSITASNGTTIDETPPTTGSIGIKNKYTTCTENCTLSFTAKGFADQESGISSCKFAVKNMTTYVTPLQDFSIEREAVARNLSLRSGQRYFVEVRCNNKAGLESSATSSDGIMVDTSPPSQGTVLVSPDRTHDVYKVHSSCHVLNTTMRAHWSGFTDNESGIRGFKVAVGKTPNMEDVMTFFDVGMATEAYLHRGVLSNVSDGEVIYVAVQCMNHAGLARTGFSKPTRLVDIDQEMKDQGNFYCMNLG